MTRKGLLAWVLIGLAVGAGAGGVYVTASRFEGAHTAGGGGALVADAIVGVRTPDGWVEEPARIEWVGGREQAVLLGARSDLVPDEGVPTVFPRSYRVVTGEGAEVAGRPTNRTTVIRTATNRTALVLETDRATGAVLGRTSYRQDGTTISRMEVTRLRHRAASDSRTVTGGAESTGVGMPEASWGRAMTEAEFRQRADFTPIAPGALPAGYGATGFYGHQCERGRWYAEYRYSDGLRLLSIYERHPRGGGGPQGRGPGGGYGRGYGRGGGGARDTESAGPRAPGAGRVDVVDEGLALTFRQRRGDRVILVTGDITRDEAFALLGSVPIE